MLVFVDESGHAGMKLGSGSSDFFIVTAVLFEDKDEDKDEAQKCDDAIHVLRNQLKLKKTKEFHFSKDSDVIRKAFLQEVISYDFSYTAVVIHKRRLTSSNFWAKETLIKYASRLVFQNLKPHLNDAIVVIDRSGTREFRNQLKHYLQKRIK